MKTEEEIKKEVYDVERAIAGAEKIRRETLNDGDTAFRFFVEVEKLKREKRILEWVLSD